MTIRLPDLIDKKIQAVADEEMVSKNAIIVRACRELLKNMAKEVVMKGG